MTLLSFDSLQYNYRVPYAMTNQGLELTLEMPERLGERGNVIMPLNCLRTTKNARGISPTQALAIHFTFACSFRVRALEACRVDLISVDFDPESHEAERGRPDFSKVLINEHDVTLAKEVVIIGAPTTARRMRSWKVYFRQDGL